MGDLFVFLAGGDSVMGVGLLLLSWWHWEFGFLLLMVMVAVGWCWSIFFGLMLFVLLTELLEFINWWVFCVFNGCVLGLMGAGGCNPGAWGNWDVWLLLVGLFSGKAMIWLRSLWKVFWLKMLGDWWCGFNSLEFCFLTVFLLFNGLRVFLRMPCRVIGKAWNKRLLAATQGAVKTGGKKIKIMVEDCLSIEDHA
ncbi:hypothetical protein MA16_Dca026660 [Dendrobium catenatum]|uniref:Transmembrane protein n=1 Tax=Dendrobium catenatum TaxID=906689 RepID=A0A2I0XIY7_9ASPA|nr:hypothetical protein MA16_Dca026660 [Dendrobium catenatum]